MADEDFEADREAMRAMNAAREQNPTGFDLTALLRWHMQTQEVINARVLDQAARILSTMPQGEQRDDYVGFVASRLRYPIETVENELRRRS